MSYRCQCGSYEFKVNWDKDSADYGKKLCKECGRPEAEDHNAETSEARRKTPTQLPRATEAEIIAEKKRQEEIKGLSFEQIKERWLDRR